jgi:hypothetical protein
VVPGLRHIILNIFGRSSDDRGENDFRTVDLTLIARKDVGLGAAIICLSEAVAHSFGT